LRDRGKSEGERRTESKGMRRGGAGSTRERSELSLPLGIQLFGTPSSGLARKFKPVPRKKGYQKKRSARKRP